MAQPFSQRTIIATPDAIIPPSQRTHTALDENVIADHLEKFLLAEDNESRCMVYSAIFGGCHVYCFPPSEILKRNYWTLVTMGMSGTKMNVPQDIVDADEYQYAEVMCYLPATWDMSKLEVDSAEANEHNWPIKMLRSLASYVAATRSWLAENHGIPNLYTEPAGRPFCSGTKLANMILLDPVEEDDDFCRVYVDGKAVNFYLVVPLTPAEAKWKSEVGAERSIYYIIGNKRDYPQNVLVDYVIDSARPCSVVDLHCRDYFDNLPVGEGGDDDEEEDDDEWEDVDEDEDDDEGEEGEEVEGKTTEVNGANTENEVAGAADVDDDVAAREAEDISGGEMEGN